MSENKPTYSLQEIATWDEEQKVSLPTVQRGFVWKPHQIENLWDSLLRGYPVGAFVLSDAGNNTFHILDGQQRATAICLGFARETFRDSQDFYKVFIDLELPKADDNRKYIFRVITRAHPWGYRKQENTKTLTAENIRKAMDWYDDVADPLNTPLEKFFPYDAGLPVPFYLFLDEASKDLNANEVIKKINQEYKHWHNVKRKWLAENEEELSRYSEQEAEAILEAKINRNINFIFNEVKEMLDPAKGQKIPALYISLSRIMAEDKAEAIDASDEVENLFVRLNSGGTQLSGEELNYSILKAHLEREVQDEIESACKQLFKPARFITIAYRLFQQENKEAQQTDALTMRIKPKQFQRTISKQSKDFETFVLNLIRDKKIQGKTLLKYAQTILEYNNKSQPFGLPFLIYSKIADTAPELMFLLLYRIKFKKDRFSAVDKTAERDHRTMLGMLTLFMWFGKGENLKDHAKLLANIWPTASTLEKERFWSSETVERAYLNEVLLPFPSFKSSKHEYGLERILEYNLTEKTNVLNRFETKAGEEYKLFLQKVIYNRDLILYAQRHFIESYFSHQQFRLEDTSLPFDWDHISPNKLVRNKKNIPRIARDWYQTNGNFRAWPYALNRMDSDSSPAYKLNPLEIREDENGFNEIKAKWQGFIDSNKHLISGIEHISKKLTDWSFCEPKWAECYVSNIRYDWKNVTKLNIDRNIRMIQEWYQELTIEALRKENRTNIKDLFDNRKWSILPINNSSIDDEFDTDENINRISSSFAVSNIQLHFYFSYPDGDNGHLEDGKIEFGLFEKEGNNYIRKMKNKTENEIDFQNFKWVFKDFTLVSGHLNSYINLVQGMANWLRTLPVANADKELLINQLKEILSSKFKATLK